MITISLDEAGVFEQSKNSTNLDSETTLIGGILFDDKDIEGEFSAEKHRIEAYYLAVMEKAAQGNEELKLQYPEDLHVRTVKRKGAEWKNTNNVRLVKKTVTTTLPEFMATGTFEGKQLIYNEKELPPRQGEYTICAVVKSEKGKSNLLKEGVGDFFNDAVASNIYYHIASETVEHLIFHNPIYPNITNINLDIATRQTAMLDNDAAAQYEELGHIKNKGEYIGEGQNQFSLMNSDVFRTILTEQMMNEDKRDLKVSKYRVRPIRYYNKKKNADQVFLYLADTICSFITWKIGKDDIKGVTAKAQQLISKKNLIFAYDEADLYFKRAWKYTELKKYYDALKELYKINEMKSEAAELYKKYWSVYIFEKIKEEFDECINKGVMPGAYIEALSELRDSYMTNTLNLNKNTYIFNVLKRIPKKMKVEPKYYKMLYYINDIGVLTGCHEGNLTKAKPYFRKCEKYAASVNIEDYIRTRNRYTNALLDRFEYENAIGVIGVTCDLLEGLYKLSKSKLGNRKSEHFGKIELGKTLSLYGYICSFMNDSTALDYFAKALDLMRDDADNVRITQSYLMHYLIETGDRKGYEEVLENYSGGQTSAESQLNEIVETSKREGGNVN